MSTFYYNDIYGEPLGQSVEWVSYEMALWQTRRLTGWICFWEDGADNETALSDGHLFWAQPHQRKTQTDCCFPVEVSVWQTDLQIGSAALSRTSAGGKVNHYQRPVGSLGCNIHHKAECLCWGCSICVFHAAGGKIGTCFILLQFVRDHKFNMLVCACVLPVFIL